VLEATTVCTKCFAQKGKYATNDFFYLPQCIKQ